MQWRYKIIAAYMVIIGITVVLLYYLAPYMPSWFLGLVVFSDYASLGFFFLGGLMLFENSENTRSALTVTPLSSGQYLTSKAITLTLIALLASIALAWSSQKPVNWPLYLACVSLISVQYIGLSALMGTKFKTITAYLVGSVMIFLPVTLPCLAAFLDPMPVAFAFVPASAQLKLIFISFDTSTPITWQVSLMLVTSTLTALMCMVLGQRALAKEFGQYKA